MSGLIYLMLFTFGCEQSVDKWESFGEEISAEEVPGADKMVTKLSESDTVKVKFTAEIEDVCQMKGCWMTLKSQNGDRIRVTFKDYGFFVPKDAADKEVIVEGMATMGSLDEATAKHYADDAGREFNPDKNLKEISIVASGVLIKKEPSQL